MLQALGDNGSYSINNNKN